MKPCALLRTLACGVAGLLSLLAGPFAHGQATLYRLGLYDGEYTASSGLQYSGLEETEGGYAIGYSEKYSGSTDLGEAAWVANASTGATTRVGLFNAAYIRDDGYQHTEADELDGGYVTGSSNKYNASTWLGEAAWVANASTGVTNRIGLFDAAYTRDDGYQNSEADWLVGGYVTGYSERYSDSTFLGEAAWVANASTGATIRIGLFDASYTRDDGYQQSLPDLLAGGYAAGTSLKYSGSTTLGEAAWIANASTGATTRIGFFDADYTQTGGQQRSMVGHLAGSYVTGGSEKYGGATDPGWAAWVADASTGATTRIGLFDASSTRSDGFQFSSATLLAGGYAAGFSERYSDSTWLGRAVWVANASTGATTRIGLFDDQHTQIGGFQSSTAYGLAGGYAAGTSEKYSGATHLGQAAWVANASTGATTRVGLFDAPYTRTDGFQSSTAYGLAGGYAAGFSAKYSGSTFLGQAAWVANASSGTTTRVGLFDAQHTQSGGATPGFQYSSANHLVEGFAAGYSLRYHGETQVGQTAWIYNLDTSTLDSIVLSLRVSDGYAYSEILSLSDSGLAVGFYTLFDSSGVDLGARAFAWTPEDGAFDLASVVEGGISSAGFNRLIAAQRVTPNLFGGESILGHANAGSNADTAAVYVVVVPEPGSAALLALGAAFLAVRRRR